MSDYRVLDTSKFNNFISARSSLIQKYDDISRRYTDIVNALCDDWKGNGADAFKSDAQKVKTNILGIQDILQTMCDTLSDCRDIFGECDSSLGSANRDALEES